MNPAVALLILRQGNSPLEDYVADFCKLCHVVGFNDVAPKGIFRNRLKDCLKKKKKKKCIVKYGDPYSKLVLCI